MKPQTIFLLLIFTGLFSCTRIITYTLGVRQPKEETKESLKKFISNYKIDTNTIYIPRDTSAFYKLNKLAGKNSGYIFFNSKKEMLMYKDTGSACSAPIFVFTKNLCDNENRLFYKSQTISILTKEIVPLFSTDTTYENYDKYVFIFWYKYFGKNKFKSDVVDVLNSLKDNKCKTKLFLINLDLQPGWKKDIPIKISM